jgi:rSAM/selenodomain-associated transferase 1
MVDLQGQAAVAVLTRAPSAGGKTRLFADMRRAPDPELLAALLLDTLEAVRVPSTACVVCYTPPDAEREMRALVPPDVILVAQRGEGLGERMRLAFDDLFAGGAASVVLIGSDLPALDSRTIADAHRVLRARPDIVVLGPAADGGYYLIGATRTPAGLLDGLAWGTAHVLAETERRARDAGIEIERVAGARDVDTLDDLRALIGSAAAAPHTRRVFARFSQMPNI